MTLNQMSLRYQLLNLIIVYGVFTCNGFQTRIVNGFKAHLGEIPYQASVQINSSLWCGGAIIDEFHVLTVAHCFINTNVKEVSVVVGSVDLSNDPGIRYQVSEMKFHDGYAEWNGWPNDIALFKLSQPIQFNDFVKPVKLPKPDDTFEDDETAVVSGYGKLNPYSASSPVLYKTQVFIVNNGECQKHYSLERLRPTHICTRSSTKTGWCQGDSGGPLTVDGKLVGLVAFSQDYACAWDSMAPQVYTRISKYIDWIKEHM